jgi:V-type H+-transporting ATPase subunit a
LGWKGAKNPLADARYLLLFMGFFAIYCGFMYNEFFCMPMNLFGTNWQWDPDSPTFPYAEPIDPDRCYPFGVDPAWRLARNELDYYNSLKMKMSVLMGVTQMVLGLFLSLLNSINKRNYINIFFEFIPQVLFMLCIFGYMCFLVVLKWLIDWNNVEGGAPRLLNVMISMVMMPFSLPDEYKIFPGQHVVQLVLLCVAFVAVPWMLIPKPLALRWQHARQAKRKGFYPLQRTDKAQPLADPEAEPAEPAHDEAALVEELPDPSVSSLIKPRLDLDAAEEFADEHGEHFVFSEICVHQIIHTIEYVLGCVSNTASYLRLWALSLAHSGKFAIFRSSGIS